MNPSFELPESEGVQPGTGHEANSFPTQLVNAAESGVYIDPSETVEKITELQKLKTQFMMGNMATVDGDFGFNIIQNRFFTALREQGVTGEELQVTRLYHLLISSTMDAAHPPTQFDVAGGAIEHFIRTQGAEYKTQG